MAGLPTLSFCTLYSSFALSYDTMSYKATHTYMYDMSVCKKAD